MIALVLSKNTDVVALIPALNLNTTSLKEMTSLNIVHGAGYRVECLISDNNRINRNMFTALCNDNLKPSIPHPFNSSQNCFFSV